MVIPEPARKVLLIQSHVVHGYVGNRAATFPLQCQGWDVDTLNTVNFSNHTGYGTVFGTKTTAAELGDIYKGLTTVGVAYDALLTGYIPGREAVAEVGRICVDVKRRNPQSVWLLDPVMGDEGELYVEQDVIPAYREILRSGLVDIITPNQFEAELLLGLKITDTASLKACINHLHAEFGVRRIVLSSLDIAIPAELLGQATCSRVEDSPRWIYAAASLEGQLTVFKIPYIESYFTGVGDLFSAMLLDRVARGGSFADNVNEVLSVMLEVLKVTHTMVLQLVGDIKGQIGSPESMKHCELRVVECRDVFGRQERYFTGVEV